MGNIDLNNLLFTFRGRVNRGKFWLAALIYFIVGIALGMLNFVLGMIGIAFVALLIGGVVNVAVAISGIAVGIKRLHDRNKSGWWLLFFYLAMPILIGIAIIVESDSLTIVLSLAAAAAAIWMFVELGCLRGTMGTNQYGPDPLTSA